jgi:predicted transport protein
MASPDNAVASMIANLQAKTGKSLEQWIAVAAQSKAAKHGEIVKLLKAKHGLGHGYANLVAQRTLGGPASGEDLVAAQYDGARSALKPIYDALVVAAKKLGADVEIAPKKSSVSLRRSKQFALIEPATSTRIDLGLQLKGVPVAGRLEKYPSTMCTHRVRLESKAQVDAELLGWMKQAYDAA